MKVLHLKKPMLNSIYTAQLDFPRLELTDLTTLDSTFLRAWRMRVKEHLDWVYTMIRPRICLVCREPFNVWDMHEGIVTRGDVRGWPMIRQLLIMCALNCIPLHHTCHIDHPPQRGLVWEVQCEFYGEQPVREWYEELPWKAGPPRRF